jgi:hypothetical protein
MMRLVFYWMILAMLAFSYYLIIDALYVDLGSGVNERALVPQLIAMVNVPLNLFLALVRLLVLKGIKESHRFFDIIHFVIPALIAIACLAIQLWIGIILSVFAIVIIGYELTKSIIKKRRVSYYSK